MPKTNAANVRIKHAYFQYLREAKRRNDDSIDGVAAALARFEDSTNHRDFGKFHRQQAVAFKQKLNEQLSARSGQRLSRATVHSTLSALKAFFIWLVDQPGFKRKISYTDADYFNLSEGEVRIAKARREKPFPSLDQAHHALSQAPATTDIELRDRAVLALTLLTGARDGAIVCLKLKHLNLGEGLLDQDARDVKTKFSKTFSTWFFPVGGEALAILTDWVDYLRRDLLWGDADPLFPATRMDIGPDGGFIAGGLKRENWSTAEPIRRIFRQLFERAGLPYFKPHAIRDTLAQLGEQRCKTPEDFKAWSQNLGHEKVLTTFTSYGVVPSHRQAELIRRMAVDASLMGEATIEARLAKLARLEAAMGAT